ncbi:hypothetical protein ACFLZ1_04185 [Patescibacteria group bacterium]
MSEEEIVGLPVKELEFKEKAYRLFFLTEHLNIQEFEGGFFGIAESDEWGNIADHGAAAAIYADILCDLFEVEPEVRKRTVKAAALHDSGKVQEILAFRKKPQPTTDELKEMMEENRKRLEGLQIDPDIVSLAQASIPETEKGPTTLEEQIVWYVDAMLMKAEPVKISQRMDEAVSESLDEARSARNRAIHELFTYGSGGETKNLHQVQKEIGEKLSQEFVDKLQLGIDPGNLHTYLKTVFSQRVADFDWYQALENYFTGFEKLDSLDAAATDQQIINSRFFVEIVVLLDRYSRELLGKSVFGNLVARSKVG